MKSYSTGDSRRLLLWRSTNRQSKQTFTRGPSTATYVLRTMRKKRSKPKSLTSPCQPRLSPTGHNLPDVQHAIFWTIKCPFDRFQILFSGSKFPFRPDSAFLFRKQERKTLFWSDKVPFPTL